MLRQTGNASLAGRVIYAQANVSTLLRGSNHARLQFETQKVY